MTAPAFTVRMAPGVLPGAGLPTSAQWVDITAYVKSIAVRTGRQQDLDRIEAGTATITLENSDGRFTPDNTAGAYYPNIRPFMQMQVLWSAATSDAFTIGVSHLGGADSVLHAAAPAPLAMFTGLVEAWKPTWWTRGGEMVVEVVDAFRYLQLSNVAGSYPAQTVGERIAQILADIGSPFSTIIESTGVSLAAATVNQNALDYVKSIAQLDGGLFYINGDGRLVFNSSSTLRAAAFYKNVQATIGDSGSEIHYLQLDLAQDEQLVVNKIDGKTSDSTAITTQSDSTSQSNYGVRPYDYGTTPLSSVSELQARAAHELVLKKDARLAAQSVAFNLYDAAIDAATLIALQLYYLVTVKRRPSAGSTLSSNYLIQGVEHDIKASPKEWIMRLRISSGSDPL